MKLMLAAASIAAIVATATPTSADLYTRTGMDVMRSCSGAFSSNLSNHDLCTGYFLGFAQAMIFSRKICIAGGAPVSSEQMLLVVRQYLRENPAKLNFPGPALVGMAMQNAWPCQ